MVKIAKKAKSRSNKPSRKDIKGPDQFIQTTEKGIDWLTRFRIPILILLVGILLVSIGIFGFNYYTNKQQQAAGTDLGESLKVVQAEIKNEKKKLTIKTSNDSSSTSDKTYKTAKEKHEALVKSLEGLSKKHQGTRSANIAKLYMANSYLQQKQFDKAKALYEEFTRGLSSQDPMYYLGMNGLAYVLEAQGKEKESLAILKDLKEKGDTTTKAFALMRLAEYHQHKNQLKEAKTYYEALAKDKSPYQSEAKKRLAILP